MDIKELVETHGPMVSALANRMLRDKELAKDASQEVWYEVIKGLDGFKGNSKLSTWIYTIAKRTILKHAQNKPVFTEADIDQCIAKGQIAYDGEAEQKEAWIKEKCDDCLTAFCHCLRHEARLVFLLRENLNLPHQEISEIMGLSVDNVRQVASRSLKKVRSFMNKDCTLLNPNGRCGCRIRQEIQSIDYDKKYEQLRQAYRLAAFYKKFDKELPRKNFWEQFVN